MIRIIGTRIIVPRGDTGFFTLQNRGIFEEGNVAVFSVLDPLTRATIIEKQIDASQDTLFIELEREDTEKLDAGKYFWDVSIWRHPFYDEDNVLIDAQEIDSFYAAQCLPQFIIKEVPKNGR